MADQQQAAPVPPTALTVDWLRWIQSLGLPTALLMGLLYGIWSFSNAILSDVAKPLVDRHVKFLDKMESLAESHEVSLREHDKALVNINRSLEAITKRLDETRYGEKHP